MSNIGCKAVADDVIRPFVTGSAFMTCANEFGLQELEVAEGAEFVCHDLGEIGKIGDGIERVVVVKRGGIGVECFRRWVEDQADFAM